MHGYEIGMTATITGGEECLKPLKATLRPGHRWRSKGDVVSSQGLDISKPPRSTFHWIHLTTPFVEWAIRLIEGENVRHVLARLNLLDNRCREVVCEISKQHRDELEAGIVCPSSGWVVAIVVVPIDGRARLHPDKIIVGVLGAWNID